MDSKSFNGEYTEHLGHEISLVMPWKLQILVTNRDKWLHWPQAARHMQLSAGSQQLLPLWEVAIGRLPEKL